METSRDSSVWRSLAVTFGGGLALGAVGMRLTQTALRPAEALPRPEPQPEADRLDHLERRLERMETVPVSVQGAVTAQIDQKVLEAVVGAVEARIHEHASQVERRIADLEARVAIDLQSLVAQTRQRNETNEKIAAELNAVRHEMATSHQQNERIIDTAEQRFAEMRYEYQQEIAGLRTAVEAEFVRSDESVGAIAADLRALRHEHMQYRDASERRMAQEIATQLDIRAQAMEHSIETRMVTIAASAAAERVEEQLAPLRAEVQQKEKELSELRARLADSERSVLDVILAIGHVCRQAAEHISGKPDAAPIAVAQEPVSMAPVEAVSAVSSNGIPEQPAAASPDAPSSPAAESLPARIQPQPMPGFLQDPNRKDNWRIPLVSSFLLLVSTGLVVAHYL